MHVLKEIKTVIFRGFSRIEIAGVKKIARSVETLPKSPRALTFHGLLSSYAYNLKPFPKHCLMTKDVDVV